MRKSLLPVPPVAAVRPRISEIHGDRRVDDYAWLRAKEDPEVLAHLGDAYWRIGREAEARSQWQRALGLADEPSQLSSNGADFLHGVGIAGWRAAIEDRLSQGLTAADEP